MAYPVTSGQTSFVLRQPPKGCTRSEPLNPPTSWYWNIRIGDKIQINNTGIYYTVVGPMNTRPNPELFVNIGTPGTARLQHTLPTSDNPYSRVSVPG